MTEPAVGQRWKHTNHGNSDIFIAEIAEIKPSSLGNNYMLHILQIIRGGSHYDYPSALQSNERWTWEYLPGQDKNQ